MKGFFMKAAILLAHESNCVSKKVGAVIVKDGRIISTGYNGSPKGYVNCSETFNKDNFDRECHHEWSNKNEIHAEMNAIIFAAKNGISINDSDIYCTLQPCEHCLKNIVQSGIKNIYYLKEYDKFDKDDSFMKFIHTRGINYLKISSEELLNFEKILDNK